MSFLGVLGSRLAVLSVPDRVASNSRYNSILGGGSLLEARGVGDQVGSPAMILYKQNQA